MSTSSKFYKVKLPEITENVVNVEEFTPGSHVSGKDYVGWNITTESGKVVSFYTNGHSGCCEYVSIERYTSRIRRMKTALYEAEKKEGFSCVYSLNLEFPDRQSFRIQNEHNGYYAHTVYLEIDGEPYETDVALMV